MFQEKPRKLVLIFYFKQAGNGVLTSNESKNQTKVDQLIHPIRTKIFYSIYLE